MALSHTTPCPHCTTRGNASIFLMENTYIERSLRTQRGRNHRKIVHAAGNQSQSLNSPARKEKNPQQSACAGNWVQNLYWAMFGTHHLPTTPPPGKASKETPGRALQKLNLTRTITEKPLSHRHSSREGMQDRKLKTMRCSSSSPTSAFTPWSKGPQEERSGVWKVVHHTDPR